MNKILVFVKDVEKLIDFLKKEYYLVLFPSVIGIIIMSLTVILNIGPDFVRIPSWYVQKDFEAYPISEFQYFWLERSVINGSIATIISFMFLFTMYKLSKRKK